MLRSIYLNSFALAVIGIISIAQAQTTPVFPRAIAPQYAAEPPGRARMHTCLEQFTANKQTNANGGLNWIEKGGGYYSECNKRLADNAQQTPTGPGEKTDTQTAQAVINLTTINYDCQSYRVGQGYRERNITATFRVDNEAQAAQFGDQAWIQSFINKAVSSALEACRRAPNFGGNHMPPPMPATQVTVEVKDALSWSEFRARSDLSSGRVEVIQNTIFKAHMERMREAAEQQKIRESLKLAAEEKEKRKDAARADCGTAPALSGGPWFSWLSSTYKIAALDAAGRALRDTLLDDGFLCVKTVEYISPAPNPSGGNAARVKLIGYNADGRPRTSTGDIFY